MKHILIALVLAAALVGIGIGIATVTTAPEKEPLNTPETDGATLAVPAIEGSGVEEMIVVDEDSGHAGEEDELTILDESDTVTDLFNESTGEVRSVSKTSEASVTTGEDSRLYLNPEHEFNLTFPLHWSAEFIDLDEYLVQIDRQDPDQFNPGSGAALPNQAYLTVNAFTENHESYASVQELLTSGTSLESDENTDSSPSSDTITEESVPNGNGITGKVYTRESSNEGTLVNTLITGYAQLPSGTIVQLKGGVGTGPDSSFLIPELKEIINSITE